MKHVMAILAAIVLGTCAACCNCDQVAKYEQRLKAYEKYRKCADAMLDSCYSHDPNWFDDVLSETDAWQDYMDAYEATK